MDNNFDLIVLFNLFVDKLYSKIRDTLKYQIEHLVLLHEDLVQVGKTIETSLILYHPEIVGWQKTITMQKAF